MSIYQEQSIYIAYNFLCSIPARKNMNHFNLMSNPSNERYLEYGKEMYSY